MSVDVEKWAAIVTGAVEIAMRTAKDLGIDPPGEDELNAAAAKVLPAELAVLAAAVNLSAVRNQARIASLGTAARCPRCSGVLTIHSEVSPGGGNSSQTTSCSECGWKSTNP